LFGLAEIIGANAFIAAFVGGLVFGAASTTLVERPGTSELLEIASDLLGFLVWFFAGGILLTWCPAGRTDLADVALAVLALTVLRIVPVFLSTAGHRLQVAHSDLFIGWFGPRGLATIVFGLLAYEELGPDSPVMARWPG
jgi:NhaP-type Na+/H+ or K+/H+ antiporter